MSPPTAARPVGASPPQGFSPFFLRSLLALVATAYFGLFALRPTLLPVVGVNYFGAWFLDSFAILASNDALARGLDVYAANPLDYLQRPHVYSRWWLGLGELGLTRADNFRVGLVLVCSFFGVALTVLRPRTAREMVWYLAVLCSSPVLLAVHRANNDLAIFILLAGLVPCLVSRFQSAHLFAGLMIAMATGLKFYPAAAALLLLGAAGSPRAVGRGLIFAAIAIAVVLAMLLPDLARLGSMLPEVKAEGLMTFGAANIFGGLGLSGWPAFLVGVIAAACIVGWFFRAGPVAPADLGSIERSVWLRFVLGAVLLTACFFSGVNFAYRWIFSLWLAPFLWMAWHESPSRRTRRFAAITGGLMIVALWADALAAVVLTCLVGKLPGATLVRWADGFFLAEQPVTWAFFACLVGWLVHFTRTEMRPLFNRRQPAS
jgi:hypothetical protein